jgi:hypothetical protein
MVRRTCRRPRSVAAGLRPGRCPFGSDGGAERSAMAVAMGWLLWVLVFGREEWASALCAAH